MTVKMLDSEGNAHRVRFHGYKGEAKVLPEPEPDNEPQPPRQRVSRLHYAAWLSLGIGLMCGCMTAWVEVRLFDSVGHALLGLVLMPAAAVGTVVVYRQRHGL